jgi:hypothetical protein
VPLDSSAAIDAATPASGGTTAVATVPSTVGVSGPAGRHPLGSLPVAEAASLWLRPDSPTPGQCLDVNVKLQDQAISVYLARWLILDEPSGDLPPSKVEDRLEKSTEIPAAFVDLHIAGRYHGER